MIQQDLINLNGKLELRAQNGRFLGLLSSHRSDPNSIINPLKYGNASYINSIHYEGSIPLFIIQAKHNFPNHTNYRRWAFENFMLSWDFKRWDAPHYEYGIYGGMYGQYSPYNRRCMYPPVIVCQGQYLGLVTKNQEISVDGLTIVDPDLLISIYQNLFVCNYSSTHIANYSEKLRSCNLL